MSDFEIAFRAAIVEALPHVKFRFCYLHFSHSLRGNVKSINKKMKFVINENSLESDGPDLPSHIAVMFSALMFVPDYIILEFFF